MHPLGTKVCHLKRRQLPFFSKSVDQWVSRRTKSVLFRISK